jgi:acetolactate synthase regulatory subunit
MERQRETTAERILRKNKMRGLNIRHYYMATIIKTIELVERYRHTEQ